MQRMISKESCPNKANHHRAYYEGDAGKLASGFETIKLPFARRICCQRCLSCGTKVTCYDHEGGC